MEFCVMGTKGVQFRSRSPERGRGRKAVGFCVASGSRQRQEVRHRRGVIVLLHPATVAPRPPGPRQRRMDRLEPIYADFFQSIL